MAKLNYNEIHSIFNDIHRKLANQLTAHRIENEKPAGLETKKFLYDAQCASLMDAPPRPRVQSLRCAHPCVPILCVQILHAPLS